jgi:hypothetical protein
VLPPGRAGRGRQTGRERARRRACGRRACSALALIGDAEREAGLARLSGDLVSGEWHRKYGHLLELDELDLGYRVIVAGPR